MAKQANKEKVLGAIEAGFHDWKSISKHTKIAVGKVDSILIGLENEQKIVCRMLPVTLLSTGNRRVRETRMSSYWIITEADVKHRKELGEDCDDDGEWNAWNLKKENDMSKAKKSTASTLLLEALSDAGDKGIVQAEFTKNELRALRRLEKKELVSRDADFIWRSVAPGEDRIETIRKADTKVKAKKKVVEHPATGFSVEGAARMDKASKESREPAKSKPVKTPKPEDGWPISITAQVCSKGDACVTAPSAEQPVANFYRDRSRKTGVDCWCKGCIKAHAAAKRAAKAAS